MNESEKERLIKKDIKSIENRVRSAFNQGYEMGMKENKERSGDAISRQAVIDAISSDRYDYAALDRYVKDLPSVTPQQRTGRWIPVGYPVYDWWKCSECGEKHVGDEDTLPFYYPNCGTKMEVEE